VELSGFAINSSILSPLDVVKKSSYAAEAL
jgi:hypothetical protein